MFVEVKDEYDYNLILHKYSPPHIYIYIVVLNIYANNCEIFAKFIFNVRRYSFCSGVIL